MDKWYNYYKNKINNRQSEQRFEKKYKPFINYLKSQLKNKKSCLEMGCGTALVTKKIYKKGINYHTYDNNPKMLKLTKKNILNTETKLHNIKAPLNKLFGVVYSHGVLEHFSPKEIRQIIKTQKKYAKHLIHYVPSNHYKYKSFGDELLISKKQWEKLCKPDKIMSFNKGYDLILVWRKK